MKQYKANQSECKISIIVPVYNVKDYLEQCIKSLLHQSYKAYEIILVDDGSTDGSSDICDNWAVHPNIRVIHQDNRGLSAARNVGIQNAHGEYILFVDSDDYISEDILAVLQKYINSESPDVVMLRANKVYRNGSISEVDEIMDRSRIKNRAREDVLAYLATLSKFPGSACTKMINRVFLQKHDLYFPPNKSYEDLYWSFRLFLCADTFDYCSKDYYYYRQNREGSITNTFTKDKYRHSIDIIPYVLTLLDQAENNEVNRKSVFGMLAYHYGIVLMQYRRLPAEEKREYVKDLKKYCFLLRYRNDIKSRIARISVRLFGIGSASYFANVYYRLKNGVRWGE